MLGAIVDQGVAKIPSRVKPKSADKPTRSEQPFYANQTINEWPKIDTRLEKHVYENFEKFKYGMLKSRDFKETLRSAVNLPNLNDGY